MTNMNRLPDTLKRILMADRLVALQSHQEKHPVYSELYENIIKADFLMTWISLKTCRHVCWASTMLVESL